MAVISLPSFDLSAESAASVLGQNTWTNIAELAFEIHNTIPILAALVGLFLVISGFMKWSKNTSQMQSNNDGANVLFRIIAGTSLCSLSSVMFITSNELFGVIESNGLGAYLYATSINATTPVQGMSSAIFALASMFGWLSLFRALFIMRLFGENSQESPVSKFWGYLIAGIGLANLPITISAIGSLFI